LEDTVTFEFPIAVPQDIFTVVTANGFASKPTLFTPYEATATQTGNITCNGGSNGKASVATQGGVSAYTYLWTPGSKTTQLISGLSAGTYTVSVKDDWDVRLLLP